jgi:hypothetical protein
MIRSSTTEKWKVILLHGKAIIHIYPTSSYKQLFLLHKFRLFLNKKIGKILVF